MRKPTPDPKSGRPIILGSDSPAAIEHGTSMRRKGEMIGKLGELYFANVFNGFA